MSLKKLVTKSVDFNAWANLKFTEWLSTKDEMLLVKEIPSSYPSIFKTLEHIWAAQEFWCNTISGSREEFLQVLKIENLTVPMLFQGLNKNSSAIADYVNSLSEDDLLKNVKIENEWFQCDFQKYEYIQHLVNHATYHRGQIVTIGRNVGLTDAPMTDFNFWNLQTN